MIRLNDRTKLTTETEKALAELGGGDPTKTYGREELGEVLGNAVEHLAKHDSPILSKIYAQAQKSGLVP